MSSIDKGRAYERGLKEGRRGGVYKNPYDAGTTFHDNYKLGWDRGQRERVRLWI